eukprot:Gb_07425 [translate_table: standard]
MPHDHICFDSLPEFSANWRPSPRYICCDGVRQLRGMARTTLDRQVAYKCLKTVADSIKPLPSSLTNLLRACGVNIGIPISTDIDCSQNLPSLRQEYRLTKNVNKVMLFIEAIKALRDCGPFRMDQVLHDLVGNFAFDLFDNSSKMVLAARDVARMRQGLGFKGGLLQVESSKCEQSTCNNFGFFQGFQIVSPARSKNARKQQGSNFSGNFLMNMLGKGKESEYSSSGQCVPVEGLVYYITPPSSVAEMAVAGMNEPADPTVRRFQKESFSREDVIIISSPLRT